jgi:hypothetical protein
MVELIAVLNRRAIDLRGRPARVDERHRVPADPFADLGDLSRCLSGDAALSTSGEESNLEVQATA